MAPGAKAPLRERLRGQQGPPPSRASFYRDPYGAGVDQSVPFNNGPLPACYTPPCKSLRLARPGQANLLVCAQAKVKKLLATSRYCPVWLYAKKDSSQGTPFFVVASGGQVIREEVTGSFSSFPSNFIFFTGRPRDGRLSREAGPLRI